MTDAPSFGRGRFVVSRGAVRYSRGTSTVPHRKGSCYGPAVTQQQSFATWLTEGLSRRGYDLARHGERARFARDAGLSESTVSRLIRGTAAPDVRACPPIARVLGCKSTHVLVAAGLIPDDEDDTTPRPLTQREHLVGLVGDDTAAQDAVVVLLRALGKWAP